MNDSFFKNLFKYGLLAALFFAAFVGALVATGNASWDFFAKSEESDWNTQSTQSTQNLEKSLKSRKKEEYFDRFKYTLAKLEEWQTGEFSGDIRESELRFANGISELSVFAEVLKRAMHTSETPEQKEMVHQFAMILEDKQRSFFTNARLFTEHRLNHYFADTGIRVHVPPIRNKILEVRGPDLDTEEKREQAVKQYRKDLYEARFGAIDWGLDDQGKHIKRTAIHSAGDDTFIVVRHGGANTHFGYHN